MINKIGRHEVLLPINRNYKKVSDILDFSRLKVQEIPRSRVFLLASSEKQAILVRACEGAYCLITGMTR